MESRSAEVRLWQVLGMAFLAGGGLPLALDLLLLRTASAESVEADTLNLGIGYGVIILIGFIALVWARVLTAKDGVQHEHLDWIWTVLAWVAMPLGAAVFDLEWGQTAMGPASLEHKAVLATGGFIFIAGLIAMLGERTVQRIQHSAIRRSLDGAEQRKLTQASHGPVQ